jgi:hypothetical protein
VAQLTLVEHSRAEHRDLSTPLHLQFGQQPRHAVLHGISRQIQPGADLPVGQAIGDQRQHLPFPVGQRLQPRISRRWPLSQPGEHIGGDSPIQQRLTPHHPMHRVEQVATADLLEHVSPGPSHDRGE